MLCCPNQITLDNHSITTGAMMKNLIDIIVGDTRITVGEDLELCWHGEFRITVAVPTLTMIEDLLCLYCDCVETDKTKLTEFGWERITDTYHTTRLLRNGITRKVNGGGNHGK
jgi:hypothetical protein